VPTPLGPISSAAIAPVITKTVLNVGCGYPLRQRLHRHFEGPDWREIRLDIDPRVRPDVICSITDMRPVASESVDAVWSSHNLEHIYRHEVPAALGEFIRVLKPGGFLLVTLPDLQQIAELIVADHLDDEAYMSPSGPVTPLDMVFGHTPSLALGYSFMAHKTGFTLRSLQALLNDAGFVDIRLQRGSAFDLWATAHKLSASQ
jgi:SAM-dependent methyltransferase